MTRGPLVLAAAAFLAAACGPTRPPPPAPAPIPRPMEAPLSLVRAPASAVGMRADLSSLLDSIANAAVADSAASAVAIAVGRHGRLVHLAGYGRTDWPSSSPAVTDSTIFDLASVTKVVATTTAAMVVEDEGLLDLDRPVREYVPELADSAKAAITVRMLLTHRGGFEAGAPLHRTARGMAEYLAAIDARPLRAPPGTRTEYSDWDLVLLQAVIERVTGRPLDAYLADRVFLRLGLRETGFRPSSSLLPRIAATERTPERGLIHGEVHDPNAWALGGVAGHAGLFSSARDLAVFAQMLLNGGEHGGVRFLRPQTLARWTAPQGPGSSRALGWDTPSGASSAGRFSSPRSFGHTGYTGTSVWVDPERGLFVVLLTNRVNPTAANQRHVALRRAVADAVQSSILDAPLVDWESRRAPASPAPAPTT